MNMIQAYIDPGSGAMLFQMLMASVVGFFVFFWRSIRAFFGSKKSVDTDSTGEPSPEQSLFVRDNVEDDGALTEAEAAAVDSIGKPRDV